MYLSTSGQHDNVYKYDPQLFSLLEGRPERNSGPQDYYATMSNVVQESFSKKVTDSKQQLGVAAQYVQENFFDQAPQQ